MNPLLKNLDTGHIMKTLVKILKVEDSTVFYAEINRQTGKVMIEDYMSVERFIEALQGDYGFELVKMTKQQAIKVAAMFGAMITGWEYNRVLNSYECSVNTKEEYDNGYGYMISSVGISQRSQSLLCVEAIVMHHTFKGEI